VLETGAQGYDVVLINGSSLHIYRKQGSLASVDENQIPNLKYIDDRWRDAFIEARELAVPYFWGTLGIAYRSDLIDEAPSSWMDLFKPTESMRGKIGMIEDSMDTFGMALKALGYSANSIDPEALNEAESLLMAQKPYVGSYLYVGLGEDSALVSGDIVMTMIYSGDALMVQEHDENIQYVVPKEGGNIWVDYLTVMESSTKKDLAWAFINFLNEPENAAQLAEFVYGPTPNTAAEKLLPAEFLEDENIYPNDDVVARSEFYQPIRGRALKKRAMAYARLRQ
jgi:spermidine/putrescine transport system substrate-binding protein